MELRRLALLLELSRRGTIAAVADALSYSHSSVSVSLSELEREAGVPLLRRVGRNVELTTAGQRLVEHAQQALAADEAIRAELASVAGATGGEIRMTFVQTQAFALLPGTMERLARAAPELDVHVRQVETAPALDQLRSHTVDLVVGVEYDALPVGRRREDHRVDLFQEDVVLALHPEHPRLRRRGRLPLTSFEDEVWATGFAGTGLYAYLRHVCNRYGGYEPRIEHRSDDGLVLSALAASGRAVTLLPALLTTTIPEIATRRVREAPLQRTIFTVTRRSAAAAPAIAVVRTALRETAIQVSRERGAIALC